MTVCDPDTQRLLWREQPACWTKTTVKCVHPKKRGCPTLPVNTKQNTPDEAAMFHMLTMWDLALIPGYSPVGYGGYPGYGKWCD